MRLFLVLVFGAICFGVGYRTGKGDPVIAEKIHHYEGFSAGVKYIMDNLNGMSDALSSSSVLPPERHPAKNVWL